MVAEEDMEALPLPMRLWVASEIIRLEQIIVFSVNMKLHKTCISVECKLHRYYPHVFYYMLNTLGRHC